MCQREGAVLLTHGRLCQRRWCAGGTGGRFSWHETTFLGRGGLARCGRASDLQVLLGCFGACGFPSSRGLFSVAPCQVCMCIGWDILSIRIQKELKP